VIKFLWRIVWKLAPAMAAGIGMWWRIEQPIESYTALIQVSDLITGMVMSSLDTVFGWNISAGFLQSAVNLILVDQFNGLMTGIIISNLFSLLWWALTAPLRALGSLLKRKKQLQ
jgi:hypothetical protein